MADSDKKILTRAYSAIPFVRDKQNKLYIDAVKRQINNIAAGQSILDTDAREQMISLYKSVLKHQKLENMSYASLQKEFERYIKREMEHQDLKDYRATISSMRGVEYSILPNVKKRQREQYARVMDFGFKVKEMNPEELHEAYMSELRDAERQRRKPNSLLMSIIRVRRNEIKSQKQYSENSIELMESITTNLSPKASVRKKEIQSIREMTDFIKNNSSCTTESSRELLDTMHNRVLQLARENKRSGPFYAFLKRRIKEIEKALAIKRSRQLEYIELEERKQVSKANDEKYRKFKEEIADKKAEEKRRAAVERGSLEENGIFGVPTSRM